MRGKTPIVFGRPRRVAPTDAHFEMWISQSSHSFMFAFLRGKMPIVFGRPRRVAPTDAHFEMWISQGSRSFMFAISA